MIQLLSQFDRTSTMGNDLPISVPEGVPEIPAKATQIYPGIHTQIGQNGYSDALSPSSPLIRNEQVGGSSPPIGSTAVTRRKRLVLAYYGRYGAIFVISSRSIWVIFPP